MTTYELLRLIDQTVNEYETALRTDAVQAEAYRAARTARLATFANEARETHRGTTEARKAVPALFPTNNGGI